MTREEQKTNAAIEMYPAGAQNSLQFRVGFATGAEWADQHPRKGLWDKEKVIEWLRNNSSNYMTEGINYPNYAYNALVDDLAKAMERN